MSRCVWLSATLPLSARKCKGTPPSAVTVRMNKSCFRSGRWSLLWPKVMAKVGRPKNRFTIRGACELAPAARRWWSNRCATRPECTFNFSPALALAATERTSEGTSARNNRSKARPTQLSFSRSMSAVARPNRSGAWRAAHSPTP